MAQHFLCIYKGLLFVLVLISGESCFFLGGGQGREERKHSHERLPFPEGSRGHMLTF